MSTYTTPHDRLHAEDVLPVRSRISWGAIFAGAAVSLACLFLLSILGAAVGWTASDRLQTDQLGTGATVWAIFATLLSLFLGGWVTTQCTAGENKFEAVVYGVVLWGVTVTLLLWFLTSGVRLGMNTVMSAAMMRPEAQNAMANMSADDWQRAGKEAGLTDEQMSRLQSHLPASARQMRETMNDPETREAATKAAWWSFLGTLLSMLASVAGALMGAGPNLALRTIAVRDTTAGPAVH